MSKNLFNGCNLNLSEITNYYQIFLLIKTLLGGEMFCSYPTRFRLKINKEDKKVGMIPVIFFNPYGFAIWSERLPWYCRGNGVALSTPPVRYRLSTASVAATVQLQCIGKRRLNTSLRQSVQSTVYLSRTQDFTSQHKSPLRISNRWIMITTISY
jgi:hypothetical protein